MAKIIYEVWHTKVRRICDRHRMSKSDRGQVSIRCIGVGLGSDRWKTAQKSPRQSLEMKQSCGKNTMFNADFSFFLYLCTQNLYRR